MMKRKEFMLGAVAGLVFTAAATAGGVIDWPTAKADPIAGASGRLNVSAGANGVAFAPPQGAPLSFADIFSQVSPAVVQIDVKTRVESTRGGMIQIPGLPFAIPNPNSGEEGEDEGRTARGAGSGFFISADGFIVTNNHVVADAVEISVKMADGRELPAQVIGRDEGTDLAVIKVDGTDFPFVTFEETAQPRVGDWVIAVGNPFGLGGTATAGIVSAQGRNQVDRSFVDYLQIDAAINQGNSGGPTFDIYGRVIGVNSAIYSQTGGSVGIGFAIPASTAKTITDQLMRGQAIERGYVGLALQTLPPEYWESIGQPRNFKGAYVAQVTPGGPAATAGVREDDILVSVNGEAVANSTDATRAVGRASPGDAIRLEVLRDGRRQTINVRSGRRPAESVLNAEQDGSGGSSGPVQPPAAQGEVVEGMTVTPLTAANRSRYNAPEDVSGLVITNIARGTPASRLGFSAGMIITRANGQAVNSPDQLKAAVDTARRAGRKGVGLFVRTPQSQGAQPVVLEFAASE